MKKLFLVMLVLAAVFSMFCGCSAEDEYPPETQSIVIKTNGEQVAEVQLEDIMEMKSVMRKLTVHSSRGDEVFNFKGTLLSNILNFADPTLISNYNYVYIYGADEYISCLNMKEVMLENNVYIMYGNGDELLKTRKGEDGSMRLVVLKDYFGQRFTNYITEIDLTTDEKVFEEEY